MRQRVVTILVAMLVVGGSSRTQADAAEHGFLDRTHGGRRYVVFVPHGEPPAEGWPLILFLHGAGERGRDGRKQVGHGIGPSLRKRAESFPAMVVFPQADFADGPILETWRAGEPGGELARAILADVEAEWPIDPSRRTITGWSMGAYGALSLAAADPGHWSKVLAIAGGGEPEWGESLVALPVWLVHGERDAIVPASESRAMAAAIPMPQDRLTYSEVANAAHDIWRAVYDSDTVLGWMLAEVSSVPPIDAITGPGSMLNSGELDERKQSEELATNQSERPFFAALIISRALSLRLGNDALDTLTAGIPAANRERGLHGKLASIEDHVEFDGRTFDVRLKDMSYHGELHQSVLRGHGADRLRVEFALRNFEVRIGEIDVSNESDGVLAGPVSVIVGHREPVWMTLDVRPVATPDGLLKLSLLRSRFAIPDHNWYVQPPENIDIRGNLFTPDVVKTAIVGSIYQRKAIIEKQVRAAAQQILRQVEGRIDFSPLAGFVTALWPLPVYQPRLQVLLEETSTDRNGVSLVFGCAVAVAEGTPPPVGSVPRVTASIPPAFRIAKSTDLRAAVAVDVIGHLSAMAIETDAVQLYAADVPGRPFEELDDVAAVVTAAQTASSDREFTDVRSRFVLSEPFRVVPVKDGLHSTSTARLAIDVPRLTLTVFGKRGTQPVSASDTVSHSDAARGVWSLLAERELSIQQPVSLTTTTDTDGPTRLTVSWDSRAAISQQQDLIAASDSGELIAMFQQGWSRWATSQQGSPSALPDVAVGSSMLRLERLSWQGECLTAEFLPAATTLANRTKQPVSYCIRSEHSRWSEPFTLEPDRVHVYRTGSALQIRNAGQWSRDGRPLQQGIYDWSPLPAAAGVHWVRRITSPDR